MQWGFLFGAAPRAMGVVGAIGPHVQWGFIVTQLPIQWGFLVVQILVQQGCWCNGAPPCAMGFLHVLQPYLCAAAPAFNGVVGAAESHMQRGFHVVQPLAQSEFCVVQPLGQGGCWCNRAPRAMGF